MKILSLLLVCAFSINLLCAQDASNIKKLRLEKRSTTFQTISLVSLSAGALCGIIAMTTSLSTIDDIFDGQTEEDDRKQKTAEALTNVALGFGAVCVGSFIVSHTAGKKAASLGFQNKKMMSMQKGNMAYHSVPTVSLRFRIGK